MPLYEEKLVSPLAIRFSQGRIRSTFRDGRLLEESLSEIAPVAAPDGSAHSCVLKAPFPPIEVVRWRPKLRGDDGKALDADFGGECWFTLDNRRLYCLQSAAARLLPNECPAAVVRIMYDIPTIKSIARKFKTTSSGSCVDIAHHHDTAPILRWDWQSLRRVKALQQEGCSALCQVQSDIDTRDHTLLEDAPPMDRMPQESLWDARSRSSSEDQVEAPEAVHGQQQSEELELGTKTPTPPPLQQLQQQQQQWQRHQAAFAEHYQQAAAAHQMWHFHQQAAAVTSAMDWAAYNASMQQPWQTQVHHSLLQPQSAGSITAPQPRQQAAEQSSAWQVDKKKEIFVI